VFEISFSQGIGPVEVKQIRERVQSSCIELKIPPKNSFILLFVVDELSCNIMEHSHAKWMELKIEASPANFTATLRDDGVPFDMGSELADAKGKAVSSEGGERRLGLSLVSRLVDSVKYSRDKGVNQVILSKAWQN
jgi:anti-sigma regulatory factor (Ser/Thr protein kinase)